MEEKLNDFFNRNRGSVFALNNWIKLKNKNFSLKSVLSFIYEYFNGDFYKMSKFIDELTIKQKKYGGKGHMYNDEYNSGLDIVFDGEFHIIGNKSDAPEKGYAVKRNPNIYTKKDTLNTNYKNISSIISDVGSFLRTNYPNDNKYEIYFKMKEIREYARIHKISYEKVCNLISKGILNFSDKGLVRECDYNSGKKIMVSEETYNSINSASDKMTYFSFMIHVKEFLKELLSNPANAKPDLELLLRGLNRGKLIGLLMRNGLLERNERIKDKDDEGNYVEPKMMIKFRIPTHNFKRKLKKLYIKLFERNFQENITEEGEGATNCSSSGQFSQPLFKVQRRKIYQQ